jgi:hypothetical protein
VRKTLTELQKAGALNHPPALAVALATCRSFGDWRRAQVCHAAMEALSPYAAHTGAGGWRDVAGCHIFPYPDCCVLFFKIKW